MIGPRAPPQVPGLGGVGRVLVAQHADGLVGKIFGQVIPVFGAVGLLDEPVVLDQVGVPLVGLAADEAVEAVEALGQRPLASGSAGADVFLGDVVILADPERAVAVVLQNLADGRTLGGEAAGRTGEAGGALGDGGAPVLVVVPAGQEHRSGRRAQCRRVPLGVRQTVVGEALHRRHLDSAAIGRPCGQSGVVVQDHQNVRGTRRRLLELVRIPIRDRVAHVEFDDSAERLGHCSGSSGTILRSLS